MITTVLGTWRQTLMPSTKTFAPDRDFTSSLPFSGSASTTVSLILIRRSAATNSPNAAKAKAILVPVMRPKFT